MCYLWRELLRFVGKMGSAKACKPYVEVSAPKPEPTPVLEKVTCNCPEYRGSDFWNDPHRWCDREPDTERIWSDKERQCERTYRPIKTYFRIDNYYDGLGQMGLQQTVNYYGNMQQSSLSDLLSGLAGIGRVW